MKNGTYAVLGCWISDAAIQNAESWGSPYDVLGFVAVEEK